MTHRISLTQLGVERLRPQAKEIVYWDRTLPGFGVRVSPKGRKTFLAQYRVRINGSLKERQETLGTLAFLTVAQARERARASKAAASAGIDPVAQRRAAETVERADRQAKEFTFAKLVERYMREYAQLNTRPSTAAITNGLLKQWVAVLGDRPVGDITKPDILAFLNTYLAKRTNGSGRIAANHLLRAVSHLFNWAKPLDLITSNPAEDVAKPQPRVKSRERCLNADEITQFWAACEQVGWPVGPIFQLLLLTGQREAEVGEMVWSELDLGNRVWEIPGARTKNGKAHIVHLNDLAVEIIAKLPRINGSKYVFTTTGTGPFTNYDYGKKRLQRLMGGAADWRPHDLRRTATTVMAEIGIAPHVADKVLNHASGKISGVAAVYNRFEYLQERKAALEALGQHIAQLVGRNVITLPARQRG
jgi:integrase